MPDKTVIGFSGDGGAMYTIQAMWTAAHHGIGAKFVVCNNRSYQLLKLNVQQYWRERELPDHAFPGSFDLGHPEIRFDELARSMGVPSARVETPDEVGPAIAEALEEPGPYPDRPRPAPGGARTRRGRGQPPPRRRHEGAFVTDVRRRPS